MGKVNRKITKFSVKFYRVMKTNNKSKIWACLVICAVYVSMINIIGCSPQTPTPTPLPQPVPTATPDLQREAVLKEMGPNSTILPHHYVVRKEEGSTHLVIVDPSDNSVRVLLLYIPGN
jgi:hypothetical protein